MSDLWHIVAGEKLQELRREAQCHRLGKSPSNLMLAPRRGRGASASPSGALAVGLRPRPPGSGQLVRMGFLERFATKARSNEIAEIGTLLDVLVMTA
jgi:hypothetical protein